MPSDILKKQISSHIGRKSEKDKDKDKDISNNNDNNKEYINYNSENDPKVLELRNSILKKQLIEMELKKKRLLHEENRIKNDLENLNKHNIENSLKLIKLELYINKEFKGNEILDEKKIVKSNESGSDFNKEFNKEHYLDLMENFSPLSCYYFQLKKDESEK